MMRSVDAPFIVCLATERLIALSSLTTSACFRRDGGTGSRLWPHLLSSPWPCRQAPLLRQRNMTKGQRGRNRWQGCLSRGCSSPLAMTTQPGARRRQQGIAGWCFLQLSSGPADLMRSNPSSEAVLACKCRSCSTSQAAGRSLTLCLSCCLGSLRKRFRCWHAWQQAPGDAALALLSLLLAVDRCLLSSQRHASNGGSVLSAALLLLPTVLTCGATVLLQVRHVASARYSTCNRAVSDRTL